VLKLVKDFKPSGAITVQLIRNEQKKLNQYIEINPRFGGGAPLSIKAGANSAKALLACLAGESVCYQPNAAEDGAIFSRFDQSVRIK
jgi:carbamoyl-phosphate synthase large subunit